MHVFEAGAALSYFLLLAVGSLFAYQVVDVTSGVAMAVYSKINKKRQVLNTPAVLDTNGLKLSHDSDVEDVDCDSFKRVSDNLPKVLDKKQKNSDRFKSLMVLTGDLKEEDSIHDLDGYFSSTILYRFFAFLVITPAFIQSIELVKHLNR